MASQISGLYPLSSARSRILRRLGDSILARSSFGRGFSFPPEIMMGMASPRTLPGDMTISSQARLISAPAL